MKEGSQKLLLKGIALVSVMIVVISLLGGGGAGAFMLGIAAFVCLWVYFIPTSLACSREHDNVAAIFWLNLLLGWALLPWVGALVWALTRNRAAELIERQQNAQRVQEPAPVLAVDEQDTRMCPFCAEQVKAAAKICKHCHSELPPLGQPA